ncbi:MAG: ATP-dependent DNA helicase, partial [Clostridiales bacterium]|jgi:DNA excision repair protein ERCC-2|nr:ATP-dependent DNA helicase [Clostridiales bacterium]
VRDKTPLAKHLRKALRQMKCPRDKITGKERDSDFAAQIFGFSEAASEWLLKSNQHEMHNNVLELFFESGKFLMISEIYDNHKTQFISINDKTMTLFCLDPSEIIAEALKRAKASVLFSATLTPLPYFRETLGGNDGDTMLMLPSPFDPRRFATILHTGISTKYTDRENSYAPISEAIFTAINSKKGNYLVFFPSYIYMQSVYEIFTDLYPHIETLLQTSSMTEDSRAEFLTRFDENNPQTLVGFTVLGGIFSEGIDLAGDRLIGTIIIGVGFPKISSRHDLIRDYFNEKNGDGFDYAYVFPGMNKVLQAAGRVIRTETDSGFVLLIDSRYAEQKYKNLLPAHWTNKIFIRNAKHIPALI